MIIIKDSQKNILKRYAPDYEKYDHVNDILEILDDAMLDSLSGENYESTPETTIISKLYDEIYAQNK